MPSESATLRSRRRARRAPRRERRSSAVVVRRRRVDLSVASITSVALAPAPGAGDGAAALTPSPLESARSAGLRYVNDGEPGISRRKAGKGFRYLDPEGRAVTDEETLARVRRLAIPPAWTEVWICRSARGHLQATGRDARGRKQYRYHPRWREVRDETKYDRMLAFGAALPAIRAVTERDLAIPGLPREKVLATVVRLLDETSIRIGNDEYARDNDSYGLTTLHDEHVEIEGDRIRFHFKGKSGKEHELTVRDRRLARVVKRCQDVPGHELFQYIDDGGERQRIRSDDVNEYLRAIAGQEFTAKDFRTWTGTVLCASFLCEVEIERSVTRVKRRVAQVIDRVSAHLGNTRAVCQRCYIHPAVIRAYTEGALHALIAAEQAAEDAAFAALRPEEARMLRIVRGFSEREAAPLAGQLREGARAAAARRGGERAPARRRGERGQARPGRSSWQTVG
ncbi:DNA topoisomerase I [Sorangium cellulosum]|uniref:DNA topoisomerase n=1 Tax=Sorangium cellulosum TaxID=56 RepID=A0A4P2PVF0_SORCE|nr:DNA topoisomerase IB [Sorangium cellulosum]AUX20684.1 DNA topoisomerase I [Sorangium cellulosum]